ncbi:FtsB family cell division protein [Dermatophilus congolensis]|uniref:FtsB family cell division protein n=1 Tax=Dermatophilus congolensis TaxID=1863 RepID=UPI0009FDFAC3|nr:septum formation initiator family protein [Dermatophilus congolensis]MBO3129862.1 septum formation initiator family protein [Dermatophilus congolensis]MBO3131510.1 septum formation initiator family protein [Dermatophilus congolensis]MBO3134337.1 septum formation initiator family protein [Dermatophilus congolensis]MBO3136571.1 septum formation initiator family protein [Dermatophilus congolensis]MBO3138815.1 septum formation initiator family protein [Dermatophilus congolensis]
MASATRRPRGASGSSARRASGVSSSRRPMGRSGSAAGHRDPSRPRTAAAGPSTYVSSTRRLGRSSTKRVAVLAATVVMLLLMLVPTVRAYVAQKAQLASLQQEASDRQKNINTLQGELKRWDDQTYVEQQARERLKFVKPGETRYIVLGAEGLTTKETTGAGAVVRPDESGGGSWYDRVWASMDASDSLSPKDANAPLAPISPGVATRTDPAGTPTGKAGTGSSSSTVQDPGRENANHGY